MNDIQTLFASDTGPAAPVGLSRAILQQIHAERRRLARRRLLVLSPLSIVSAGAAFPLFSTLAQEWYASGTWQFASLLFSDTALVLAHWQSFGLSIAEAVPVVPLTAFLATVFVLFACLRMAARTLHDAELPRLTFA